MGSIKVLNLIQQPLRITCFCSCLYR